MAYAYPLATPEQLAAARPHHHRRLWLWAGVAVLVAALIAVFTVLSQDSRITPLDACGPSCRPAAPPGVPVMVSAHRYQSKSYGYSLDYDIDPSFQDTKSIGWEADTNDSSQLDFLFQGEDANGEGADALVPDLLSRSDYASAEFVYNIPGAELGYNTAAGSVFDYQAAPAFGDFEHLRIVIMAAVKHNLAVELFAVGDYQADQGEHPNPAETPVVDYLSDIANTVTFPGDRILF